VSKKDVKGALSKWLTGARDRDGKRVERTQREAHKRTAAAAYLPHMSDAEDN